MMLNKIKKVRDNVINTIDPSTVKCKECDRWKSKKDCYYSDILKQYHCFKCLGDPTQELEEYTAEWKNQQAVRDKMYADARRLNKQSQSS